MFSFVCSYISCFRRIILNITRFLFGYILGFIIITLRETYSSFRNIQYIERDYGDRFGKKLYQIRTRELMEYEII